MDIYDRLDVRKIVNAQGNVTRIGGSIMSSDVLEAMAEASRHFVSIEDLNRRIGERIAGLLKVEAAMVCSGAAGGLAISAAACMAGSDIERIEQLPDTEGMRDEFIVQRLHESSYNQSVRVAGGRLVDVGGKGGASEGEIREAFGPNTAGFLYNLLPRPGVWETGVSLERVAVIAHGFGVPVIVDASAILPPLGNLIDVPATGADLVTFSGGKALEGPQGTGILCGRRDLIAAAALNTNPNQSIGRSMKVGKEEMVGLLAAIEAYFERDHEADQRRWRSICEYVAGRLGGIPGLNAEARYWDARGLTAVWLEVDESVLGMSRAEFSANVRAGDPPVHLWDAYGDLCVVPNTLKDGEERIVADGLLQAVTKAAEPVS